MLADCIDRSNVVSVLKPDLEAIHSGTGRDHSSTDMFVLVIKVFANLHDVRRRKKKRHLAHDFDKAELR
jgi:hypothetical protein